MNDDYLAFLLRLWRVGEGKRAEWRASLEDPHTGEIRAFANLNALMAFVEAHIRSQRHSGSDGGEPQAPPRSSEG